MPVYYNKNRKVGSQSEKSNLLKNTSNLIEISGYQSYKIENIRNLSTKNGKMNKQLSVLKNIDYNDCTSLIDIGCSNGFFGIWYALNTQMKKVTFMDHDDECTQNLNDMFKTLELTDCDIVNTNFVDGMQMNVKYDVVLMLSLIHWLYSCTTETGCLFEIIRMVRQNTKKMLIIEWVDNNDYAIKSFNHIKFNKESQKSPYTLANFEEALNLHFTRVTKLQHTNTTTRVIYVAYV